MLIFELFFLDLHGFHQWLDLFLISLLHLGWFLRLWLSFWHLFNDINQFLVLDRENFNLLLEIIVLPFVMRAFSAIICDQVDDILEIADYFLLLVECRRVIHTRGMSRILEICWSIWVEFLVFLFTSVVFERSDVFLDHNGTGAYCCGDIICVFLIRRRRGQRNGWRKDSEVHISIMIVWLHSLIYKSLFIKISLTLERK